MVDANGDEVGRILYDGFGAVLTNTLPPVLTGTLPANPDAATGLVHLGGGRWYDPALGRPLQPNPMGGPPTLPQALNRYAATPLGQPGVAQAAANVGGLGLGANIGNSTASNTTSALLAEFVLGPTAVNLAQHFQPWYLMNISVVGPSRGTRGLLTRLLNEGPTNSSTARRLANGRLSSFDGLVFSRANVDNLAARLGRRGASVSARSLGRGARRAWNFGPKYLTAGGFIAGAGADVVVGGLWQGVSDAINYPGLWLHDPELAGRRMGAAGMSNATTGAMGTATSGAFFALGFSLFEFTPPGWLVFGGSIVATIGYDLWLGEPIGTFWFTVFEANLSPIERDLAPLIR